jgi:hypothetical protein
LAELLTLPDPADSQEIRVWLDEQWAKTLGGEIEDPDLQIDQFVDSSVVSIRYAFVTQLLGKIAATQRSLLRIQLASGELGAWNARSFADSVVVPWVSANSNVLGTSAEPYASKPLRRPRIARDMPDVRNRDKWNQLVEFFEPLEGATREELVFQFERVLKSLARRAARQEVRYLIPHRISYRGLIGIVSEFLSESSHGFRPLVISTALLRTLGSGFRLFSKVESQGINESDQATGSGGDITCFDRDGQVSLIAEVKARDLTDADVHSTITKSLAAEERSENVLFVAPGISESGESKIESRIQSEWASGLNIFHVDVDSLLAVSLVLLEESWRIRFIEEVGKDLDFRGQHRHRLKWQRLLSDVE